MDEETRQKLEELRHFVWLKDIPSPTCPEYIEHHRDIQEILGEIDKILLTVERKGLLWKRKR